MPVIKSAKKKLRADARKKAVNLKVKTRMKSALKKFDSKPSQEALTQAYSILDIATKKKVIPKGRANRKKSRLAILLSKSANSKRASAKKLKSKKTKSSKIPSQRQ